MIQACLNDVTIEMDEFLSDPVFADNLFVYQIVARSSYGDNPTGMHKELDKAIAQCVRLNETAKFIPNIEGATEWLVRVHWVA
jgi:hypothetical protein